MNNDKDIELPGIRLISTSPERIFLQIGDDLDLLCLPFPENKDDVTWCAESVMLTEIEYVRLDIHLETVRQLVALSDRCSARIAEFEAEVARLKADADRYEWLDRNAEIGWSIDYQNVEISIHAPETFESFANLSDAIDEAMKGGA